MVVIPSSSLVIFTTSLTVHITIIDLHKFFESYAGSHIFYLIFSRIICWSREYLYRISLRLNIFYDFVLFIQYNYTFLRRRKQTFLIIFFKFFQRSFQSFLTEKSVSIWTKKNFCCSLIIPTNRIRIPFR